MKKLLFLLPFLLIFIPGYAQSIKAMVITGGHAYDTIQFNKMLQSLKGIECTQFVQPDANQEIANGTANDFDVLVFYDMWKEISWAEKNAYIELTKTGKPFLFLHHSIASYQNWPEFEKILGGKYIAKGENTQKSDLSDFEHDVWVYGRVLKNHPVTAGFGEFRFFDEIYINVQISEKIIPLIKTTHPKSMPYIAWENHYNKSKIIYIQSGHDYRTYQTPEYRQLLSQAIKYLATKN